MTWTDLTSSAATWTDDTRPVVDTTTWDDGATTWDGGATLWDVDRINDWVATSGSANTWVDI